MPEPDPGFEELYLLDSETSLVAFAATAEARVNTFSEVRNLRIEQHEEQGWWALRFHAPSGENEAAWRKVLYGA